MFQSGSVDKSLIILVLRSKLGGAGERHKLFKEVSEEKVTQAHKGFSGIEGEGFPKWAFVFFSHQQK
jgi:hypothetical protein